MFAQRFLQAVDLGAARRSFEALVWNGLGEAARWMLGGPAIGEWTLSPAEPVRPWPIGRATGWCCSACSSRLPGAVLTSCPVSGEGVVENPPAGVGT